VEKEIANVFTFCRPGKSRQAAFFWWVVRAPYILIVPVEGRVCGTSTPSAPSARGEWNELK
jgi:hypothetical protein